MKKLELHPLCTFFPRMEGTEFEDLKEDIRTHGLRQRIIVHKGMILDGGNRYRACIEVGVKPMTTDYNGSDPVAFVMSQNMHRRHLSVGQRAVIVAAAADWQRAQRHGGNRKSDQAATVAGRSENPATVAGFSTVADRAEQSGASDRTQRDADMVVREAPSLAAEVAQGSVSLPEAVQQVTGKVRKPPKARTKKQAAPTDESLRKDLADLREKLAELQKQSKEVLEENVAMGATLDADDKLAALTAENKKLRAQVRVNEERINSLLNETGAAKKAAKAWQAKFEKLEREIKRAA